MLDSILYPELIRKKNENELTVFFHSGSILMLKGADKPDTLKGSGPYGVVFDEYATMKAEAWEEVVQPIVRANGGWCWFVGTPKGKNHHYHTYLRGTQGHPEWRSWHLKASTSGIISKKELEEAKKTMLPAMYAQEMECDFLEGEGTVFRGSRLIAKAEEKEPITGHNYVAGVDLAKYQDYTVVSVFDRKDNCEVYQARFKDREWPHQKEQIKAIAKKYNEALCVVDATGLGDPIADDLARAGVAVEPYKITSATKKGLIEKQSIWVEQKMFNILPRDETINEYESFSYEMGITGLVRYSAPIGFHDDIVLSHALAVSSLQPITKETKQPEVSRLKKHYQKLTGEYYEEENQEYKDAEAEWIEN